jgi:hypothetical protein
LGELYFKGSSGKKKKKEKRKKLERPPSQQMSWMWWFTSVIPASWEAVGRRLMVRSWPQAKT